MSCNKMYFSSKKETNEYLGSLKNRGFSKSRNVKLTPYDCFQCDGWHLTSMSQKQTKKFLRINKQRGDRLKIIKALRNNPTLEYLLAHQEPWFVLHVNDTRYWVTFNEESGFNGRIVLT